MNRYKDLYKRVYRLEQLLYESKADQDLLLKFLGDEYYDKYVRIKNKINNPEYKDIYRMIKKDPNDVKNYIDSFQSNRSNRQQDKEGAELIYNKDGWKVYRITTYEAAKFYGKHTKWCISGNYAGNEDRGKHFFEWYISNRKLDGGYYFYIKSNHEKYCLLKKSNGEVESIWNSLNYDVTYKDLPTDFPTIPEVYDYSLEVKSNLLMYTSDKDDVVSAIKAGVDVNYVNKDGETPLCHACINDEYDIAEVLLQHGANPNVKDRKGNSLITIACDNACTYLYTDFLQLLYDYGADINGLTKDNYDIAVIAMSQNEQDVLDWILSKRDFNVNKVTSEGTDLIYAITEDYYDYVKQLLDVGADPNVPDLHGDYPLHWAVTKNNAQIVELLLKSKADPNVKDSRGSSALHAAVIEDRPKIIKLLLKAGVIKSIKDKHGKTPLDYAIQDGNQIAIAILS